MSDFTLPAIDAQTALRLAMSGAATLVDLRKLQAVTASSELVRGAARRDPLAFSHDDSLMTDSRPLNVFCVHGHEVSQFACALLRVHGRDARYVVGGFEALKSAGALLDSFED